MSLSKLVLDTAEVFRPFITKIFPAKLLSSVKARVVNNAGKNMGKIEPFQKDLYPTGINLVGNIKAVTGLGQSARLMAAIIEKTGVDYLIRDFFVPPCNKRINNTFDAKIEEEFRYNINVIDVNPSEYPVAMLNLGRKNWDKRYNIGYWVWEIEELPKQWLPAMELVDEIWTPSVFATNTFKKYTDKPVFTVPHCLTGERYDYYKREHFNLPEDKFLFLVMFDSGSIMERKNPIAAIKAYAQAFCNSDNETLGNRAETGLVIKINEPELSETDQQIIRDILKDYDNTYVLCGSYGREEINSLIGCVDVFVSLHRGEGFGLVMAEAMEAGTPVIATNWSGNVEYMNSDVACMVDYELIDIPKGLEPFPEKAKWADADILQAAGFMRKLYLDREYYEDIKKKAAAYVKDRLSVERSAQVVRQRLSAILEDK